MKYDNCKHCQSHCEHAGKDREFICPGEVSCKVTFSKFIIAPEKCNWLEVEASNAELAYSAVCSWFSPKTRIAIINQATGAAVIFTRQLDGAGNLLKVVTE